MHNMIRDALLTGTAITIEPPQFPRDRQLIIVEAYRHTNGARAKRCLKDIDGLYEALRDVINEVATGSQIDWVATVEQDDGSDLV